MFQVELNFKILTSLCAVCGSKLQKKTKMPPLEDQLLLEDQAKIGNMFQNAKHVKVRFYILEIWLNAAYLCMESVTMSLAKSSQYKTEQYTSLLS